MKKITKTQDTTSTKVVPTDLDLNLVKCLSVVDSDNASDHLGENDHITKMSLYTLQ